MDVGIITKNSSEHKNVSCIYLIQSPTFKYYVGQTVNLQKRYNAYCVNNSKNSNAIHNSIEKYGLKNHIFSVIAIVDKEQLDLWERFYIKLFDSFDTEHGLNLTSGGNSVTERIKGIPKSDEWKDKVRISKTGSKRSEFSQEQRDNISKGHKGIPRTEEWVANLKKAAERRKARGGYVFSEEQLIKMREANLGKKISDETKNKLSKTLKGRLFSDETKRKISEACKLRWEKRREEKQ